MAGDEGLKFVKGFPIEQHFYALTGSRLAFCVLFLDALRAPTLPCSCAHGAQFQNSRIFFAHGFLLFNCENNHNNCISIRFLLSQYQ